MYRAMNRVIIFYIVVGSILLSALVYAADVAQYTKAINQSPEDMKYKFYQLRGLAYRNQGDIEAAIKDFSTSIRMRPTVDAYLRRGEMYFEKGAYNIAEKDFTKAIDINPSFEAYKLRALTFLVVGKLDMAIVDGTEIINLAPNVSESYNIRMEAYGQIGESKFAREDARRALSLNRRNRVASDILIRYPEKIELTGGASRYRPKGDINKYRVWASSQGFAFSKKTEEKDTSQESQENK
jgi:tetratricopeptide (TPR) repeat protein